MTVEKNKAVCSTFSFVSSLVLKQFHPPVYFSEDVTSSPSGVPNGKRRFALGFGDGKLRSQWGEGEVERNEGEQTQGQQPRPDEGERVWDSPAPGPPPEKPQQSCLPANNRGAPSRCPPSSHHLPHTLGFTLGEKEAVGGVATRWALLLFLLLSASFPALLEDFVPWQKQGGTFQNITQPDKTGERLLTCCNPLFIPRLVFPFWSAAADNVCHFCTLPKNKERGESFFAK